MALIIRKEILIICAQSEMRCGSVVNQCGRHIHFHGENGKGEDLVAEQLLVAVGR